MTASDHYVIVYQFGKVASTSLVQSLNTAPRVVAVQSHFLGEDALRRIVSNATSPTLSPYFRKHMVGQLISNLEITQSMNQILSGHDPRHLTILSLSRQPLDWLRSSIQQDIEGRKAQFAKLCPIRTDDEATRVRLGLVHVLEKLGTALDTSGGAKAASDMILKTSGRDYLATTGLTDEFLKSLLLLALRPLIWFEDHFAKCFDVTLNDLNHEDGYWHLTHGKVQFVVLRYEDISNRFDAAMRKAGVPFNGKILHANDSQSKAFSNEIYAAFESEVAQRLGELLVASPYARQFGYQGNSNAPHADLVQTPQDQQPVSSEPVQMSTTG